LEEQACLRLLNKNLEAWRRNQELRSFVAAVEDAAQRRGASKQREGPLEEWLRWARDLADREDPLNNFIDQIGRREGLR
jgi:hypothetical protein